LSKVYSNCKEALKGAAFDGMTLMCGGFGLCGIPERMIDALKEQAHQKSEQLRIETELRQQQQREQDILEEQEFARAQAELDRQAKERARIRQEEQRIQEEIEEARFQAEIDRQKKEEADRRREEDAIRQAEDDTCQATRRQPVAHRATSQGSGRP